MSQIIKAIRQPRVSVKLAVVCAAACGTLGVLGVSASQATAACVNGAISKGSTGTCVYDAQQLLNTLDRNDYVDPLLHRWEFPQNWPLGIIGTDGVFGNETWSDVYAFQNDVNVGGTRLTASLKYQHLTVDAILGPQSWNDLCRAVNFEVGSNGPFFKAAGCFGLS